MRRTIITLLAALLIPFGASAQIDAIIDAVVDAVEPTPVYDTGMIEATENLAGKIDRLNHVLFGGAEETSAAYRYKTMYSDLYSLTTAFSSYVKRSYRNAQMLERMYSQMDGDSSLHDYADLADRAWYTYESAVRNGSRIVDQFKRIFSDPNMTNREVREAAREALRELEEETEREERRMQEEMEAVQIAAGLVECADLMAVSPEAYAETGRKEYGTTVNSGGSSTTMGTFGTAVIYIISLLCVAYGLIASTHIMKGTPHAETTIIRLLVIMVISIIVILAIQQHI